MSDNGLDEMQREKRNKIGHQMFLSVFYALLVDIGLYGAGIRWLNYPANVMVILMVCMTVYLIRVIAANAYLPPKVHGRKTVVSLILAGVFSVALAIAAFGLFKNLPVHQTMETTNDSSALILFIVSAVGLLISLIAAVIKKVNDKNDRDE
jgi:amino acid transporter